MVGLVPQARVRPDSRGFYTHTHTHTLLATIAAMNACRLHKPKCLMIGQLLDDFHRPPRMAFLSNILPPPCFQSSNAPPADPGLAWQVSPGRAEGVQRTYIHWSPIASKNTEATRVWSLLCLWLGKKWMGQNLCSIIFSGGLRGHQGPNRKLMPQSPNVSVNVTFFITSRACQFSKR